MKTITFRMLDILAKELPLMFDRNIAGVARNKCVLPSGPDDVHGLLAFLAKTVEQGHRCAQVSVQWRHGKLVEFCGLHVYKTDEGFSFVTKSRRVRVEVTDALELVRVIKPNIVTNFINVKIPGGLIVESVTTGCFNSKSSELLDDENRVIEHTSSLGVVTKHVFNVDSFLPAMIARPEHISKVLIDGDGWPCGTKTSFAKPAQLISKV